jgi:transcriptional regulator with XRE-family HTH domain
MIDHDSIGARVGVRLREARLQAGLTVREVADRIGLKHSIIVKYENGTIVPSIARLQTLARLYGLSAAALLAEHDEAVPLFALLDQANVEQIEHIVQVVRDSFSSYK